MRVPITFHDSDGTVTDGTAQYEYRDGSIRLSDFRDLNGTELALPPGSEFVYEFGTVDG